jgi:hypothetical protein
MTRRGAVAALLREQPGVWVSWKRLARVGGALAWRTRVSECHADLGMVIECKTVKHPSGEVETFRRWVPSEPQQARLFDEVA